MQISANMGPLNSTFYCGQKSDKTRKTQVYANWRIVVKSFFTVKIEMKQK